jgi:hypothetical protein
LKATSSNGSPSYAVVGFDTASAQQVRHEGAMLGRHQCGDRLGAGPGLYRLMFRNQNIDAVGPAVDMIVDPFQLLFQRLRRETRAPQNAKTAGAAHRRHDIAAVAEGEQRKLGPNELGHFERHGFNS